MKHTTLAMIVFSTVLLAGSQTWASPPSEVGVTLTPDQLKWVPNPRVPGLGVANIIGKGTEAGPFQYIELNSYIGSNSPRAASCRHTAILMTVHIRYSKALGTSVGARNTMS